MGAASTGIDSAIDSAIGASLAAESGVGPARVELSGDREARHLEEAHRAVVNDQALHTAAAAGAAWLVLYATATVVTAGHPDGRRFLGDVVYVVPVALATVLSVVAARRTTGRRRRLWRLMVASNVLWLAGDLVWAGYAYLLQREAPFPSVADGLYLASYALVPAAVLVGFADAGARRVARTLLDATVVGLGLGAAGWHFLIEPQLDAPLSAGTVTGIAYPLLGVVIVVTLASVALAGHRHVAPSVWIIALAFTISSLTDATYTYVTVLHDYVTGDWLNLGWQVEAVLLCLAALCALRNQESEGQRTPVGRDLAMIPVLLGVGAALLVAAAEALRHGADPVWLAVAGVVVAGLVVRFVLSVADARRNAVRLDAALREQQHLAVTDGLTGLYNRRFFEEVLRLETERALRGDLPLALLVADLDHFKHVNDAHGHPSGDAVLVEVASRLRRALRSSDVLARYGGEEFVAILPDADRETALDIAERCRTALSREPIRLVSGRRVTATGSFGVALLGPDAGQAGARDATALLRRADRALYAAKDAGRNRVEVAPADEDPLPRESASDVPAGVLAPLELLADLVATRKAAGEASCPFSASAVHWAGLLAESLGLDPDRSRLVVEAARLHDVGLIVLGDGLLGRPGPLTAAERRVLRAHPDQSARLIHAVPGQESLAAVVRGHHERWDGRGYPDGATGPELPLETRVVAVAAAWSAMLAPRAYRPALPPDAALGELLAGRWTQFDGEVVDALADLEQVEALTESIPASTAGSEAVSAPWGARPSWSR